MVGSYYLVKDSFIKKIEIPNILMILKHYHDIIYYLKIIKLMYTTCKYCYNSINALTDCIQCRNIGHHHCAQCHHVAVCCQQNAIHQTIAYVQQPVVQPNIVYVQQPVVHRKTLVYINGKGYCWV